MLCGMLMNPKVVKASAALRGDDLETFISELLSMLSKDAEPGVAFEIQPPGLMVFENSPNPWPVEIVQKRLRDAGYVAVGRFNEEGLSLSAGLPDQWPFDALDDVIAELRQRMNQRTIEMERG